jgi:lipopolysaccharide/colanic/teichoic acid biosynthesis glycosyltransferase
MTGRLRATAAPGAAAVDETPSDGSLAVAPTAEPSDAQSIRTVIDLTSETPTVELRPVDGETQLEVPPGLFIGPLQGLLGASTRQLAAKRALDVALSLLAIVVLSPVFLLVALLVATTSRGPVVYRSIRIGRGGEGFAFWKFRTMYNGAEQDRKSYLHMNDASGPIFKIRNDPRLTRVGSFLRKSSLDELPQLFHVLSGKMSLVGPRPPLPEEVDLYDAVARQRLLVKPGLTCIWQVSGRSDVDFQTWIQMDLEYISAWSLGRDLVLLLRTVPAVLRGTGAH